MPSLSLWGTPTSSSETQVALSCSVITPQVSSAHPAGAAPHRRPIPGAVLIDGQDVGVPWSGPKGLRVSRASSTFLLLRWPGAQVLWGVSDSATYITLDPRHAHQVCWGGRQVSGQGSSGPGFDSSMPPPLGAGSVWHLHMEPAGRLPDTCWRCGDQHCSLCYQVPGGRRGKVPLRRQCPTLPLQHPQSVPHFRRDSLCRPAWPSLPGSQMGVLLLAPVKWGPKVLCPHPGLLGGPCSLPWQGYQALGGGSGTGGHRRICGGGANPIFSSSPP